MLMWFDLLLAKRESPKGASVLRMRLVDQTWSQCRV